MKIVIAQVPEKHKMLYPFADGEILLFLGDIKNMPSHVAVVNRSGKVFWGYFHSEVFRELTEDEI